ncbi:sialidase family protein [Candidatus Viridilinea mediisalina]|uniref:sialidase family protein n=1 Tax=Candidatus Viridilinea mediisalina TaxID=2024553 RepID=UPI0013FD7553|nr:sialidase family protein [Candidatus Viridilinea mediisalina]
MEISENQFGWFPDLTVDLDGNLHVIWGGGTQRMRQIDQSVVDVDLLRYRVLRNGAWGPMTDIAVTCEGGYTVRNSLVVNIDGQINALVRFCTSVMAMSAPADQAGTASAWSNEIYLGTSYYNALATDSQGRLHMLYHEFVFDPSEQANLASEVFYRRSEDGGQTWTIRQNIAYLSGGDERMQIQVDQQDRIHVVWDHGSDWYLGIDNPAYGIYRRSDDGGVSWHVPQALGIANEPTLQTTLGLTVEGNPLVVYRSANGERLFSQYSPDGGTTWQLPAVIPGVRARAAIERGLDSFSLARDSANRLHLLMVGFPEDSPASIPMVLHLIWDGTTWSSPEIVYQSTKRPMWLRAVVAQGNTLHAVWFTYTEVSDWGERRIWHSSRPLSSPQVAAPPPRSLPTAVPRPTTQPLGEPLVQLEAPHDPVVARDLHERPPPTVFNVWREVAGVGVALVGVILILGIFTITTLRRRAREP